MTKNTVAYRRRRVINCYSSNAWSDMAALSPFGLLMIVLLVRAVI